MFPTDHRPHMDDPAADSPSPLVNWSVFLGNAVLLGLPTLFFLWSGTRALLGRFGPVVGWLTVGEFVALSVSFVLTRWTVVEITAVRLHGTEALFRGGRHSTYARVGLVTVWTLCLGVLIGGTVLRMAVAGWDPTSQIAMTASGLLALAVVGFGGYTLFEFYDGVRGDAA